MKFKDPGLVNSRPSQAHQELLSLQLRCILLHSTKRRFKKDGRRHNKEVAGVLLEAREGTGSSRELELSLQSNELPATHNG